MSHGSKKWIKDYSGRIKRSRNRTKIDHYAGLKQWDWHYVYGFMSGGKGFKTGNFCPQCKHVQKAIRNDLEGYRAAEAKIREEWKALYGDRWWVELPAQKNTSPWARKHLYFYEYFRTHKDYPGNLWNYDARSYLCYKHERMYEQDRAMWSQHTNGEKSRYGYSVREGSRHYRHTVKNIMDRAKYDDDLYDDIPPYKHEWLD